MTTTTGRSQAPTLGAGGARGLGESGPALIPSPPKARRRWGLFAAMAGLVCLGALGNVWLHQATTNAKQVVAARSTIERGSVVTRDQLMTVQVGTDPALRAVPASDLTGLVGKRAAVDVAAGSLLTPASTTDAQVPAAGHSLVGVGVLPAMLPGLKLMAGDRVRIVGTPTQSSGSAASGPPPSIAAVVVAAVTGTDTTGQGAQTIITVDVPSGDAAQLAAMSASGKVAVVLDSRDR